MRNFQLIDNRYFSNVSKHLPSHKKVRVFSHVYFSLRASLATIFSSDFHFLTKTATYVYISGSL
jgi:hypothetical protein